MRLTLSMLLTTAALVMVSLCASPPKVFGARYGGLTLTSQYVENTSLDDVDVYDEMAKICGDLWGAPAIGVSRHYVVSGQVDQFTWSLDAYDLTTSTSDVDLVNTGAWITSDSHAIAAFDSWNTEVLPLIDGDVSIDEVSSSVVAGTWISSTSSLHGVALLIVLTEGATTGSSGTALIPLQITASIAAAETLAAKMAEAFEGPPEEYPGYFTGTPSGDPVNGFPSQEACLDEALDDFNDCRQACGDSYAACHKVAFATFCAGVFACGAAGPATPACLIVALLLGDALEQQCVTAKNQCFKGCMEQYEDDVRGCGVILVYA